MSHFLSPSFHSKNRTIVLATILLALITGGSFLFSSSIYPPLVVMVGIAALTGLALCVKKPVWALYFALIMVLLPTSLVPAEINSYINRVATVIAFLSWLLFASREKTHVIITPSALWLMVFIFWMTITLLWTEDFSAGTALVQRYVLRLLLFLILISNEIKTRHDLDKFMNILAFSGVIFVLVSTVTVLRGGYTAGTRLQVLDVNENTLGTSLLITLPGVFWWASRHKPGTLRIKTWLAIGFLLAVIGLIGLSGSRGSAISLGITLCAFLLWKQTRKWGLIGLVTIALGLALAPLLFSTTIARFIGVSGETVLGGRENLWLAGWDMIKDHVLQGVGIGTSRSLIIPYLINLGILRLAKVTSASLHNPIFAIWADTGLPGILLYLGVLASTIVSFVRQYSRSKKQPGHPLNAYFALLTAVFLGYMASWIKGGGMESDFSYFLMLAMLLIPGSIQLASPVSDRSV